MLQAETWYVIPQFINKCPASVYKKSSVLQEGLSVCVLFCFSISTHSRDNELEKQTMGLLTQALVSQCVSL